MVWTLEFDDRATPDFLALPEDMQARVVRIGRLLVNHGPQHVGMPRVRPIGDKLWEIRATGRDGIARAFYMTAAGRRIVVLHVIVSGRAPRHRVEDTEDTSEGDRRRTGAHETIHRTDMRDW